MSEMYKLLNSGRYNHFIKDIILILALTPTSFHNFLHPHIPRYERDSFTVVLQPAFTDLDLFYKRPPGPGQRPPVDYSYFAPDCLHPSQKLHALMARSVFIEMCN